MVFEYLDKDLKRYMDDHEATPNCPGLPEKLVKVSKPICCLAFPGKIFKHDGNTYKFLRFKLFSC